MLVSEVEPAGLQHAHQECRGRDSPTENKPGATQTLSLSAISPTQSRQPEGGTGSVFIAAAPGSSPCLTHHRHPVDISRTNKWMNKAAERC